MEGGDGSRGSRTESSGGVGKLIPEMGRERCNIKVGGVIGGGWNVNVSR